MTNTLEREFGIKGGIAMVACTQIGSGIFMSPQGIVNIVGSIQRSLFVWFASGLIAICGSLCYLELSLLLKESGAEYAFLRHGFGPMMAYLLVWAKIILIKPSALATALMGFTDYFLDTFFNHKKFSEDESDALKKLIGIMTILFITLVNSYSVKMVKNVQKALFYFMMVPITFILVLGFRNYINSDFSLPQDTATAASPELPDADTAVEEQSFLSLLSSFSEAFYMSMWSYDGWQALCYATEEVKKPNKTLPMASLLGTLIVMTLYITLNLSYFSAISLSQFHQLSQDNSNATIISAFISNSVTMQQRQSQVEFSTSSPAYPDFNYTSNTYGNEIVENSNLSGVYRGFFLLIMLGVLSANFNTTLSNAFTTARLTFVAARHGHLPKFMSFIDPELKTPSLALYTNCIMVIILLCVKIPSFSKFVKTTMFTQWLFHGLSFAAVINLRFKMPHCPRPFRVPLPIAIFMCLFSAVLVITPILQNTMKFNQGESSKSDIWDYLIAIVVLLAGYIVFFISKYLRKFKQFKIFMTKLMHSLQIIFKVIPENTTRRRSKLYSGKVLVHADNICKLNYEDLTSEQKESCRQQCKRHRQNSKVHIVEDTEHKTRLSTLSKKSNKSVTSI